MSGFRSRSESGRAGTPRPTHGTHTAMGNSSRAGMRNGSASSARQDVSGRSTGYVQRRPEQRQAKSRQGGSGDKPRDVALAVVRDVTMNGAYANLVLPAALKNARLDGRDAAFATEITYGSLRATGLLDAVIETASGRPVAKIDSMVLDILRLGTYQILRTRVDDHAAVNTSVELAKSHGAGQASGFVNGVLRTITRTTPERWLTIVAGDATLSSLALRYAHPTWIAEAFNNALARDLPAEAETGTSAWHPELEDALRADDARPMVHLVARPGQISAEELALITGGEEGELSPYAVHVEEGAPAQMDPVREGLAHVQDEGSQLIALALVQLGLQREDKGRWLDLCAGPGGKTAFIASWAMGHDAHVDAVELAPHRAELVEKATRGLPVTVYTGDGRDLSAIPELDMPAGGYDRVLLDAPCSGLGALRRRPEARWRKSHSDILQLVTLQRELLRSALSATAPGGVTVYSTCSPHIQETTSVVASVAQELGAEIVDLSGLFPQLKGNTSAPFIQLWPHRHGTDAMFIAALRPGTQGSP